MIPREEQKANEAKARTDSKAAELLNFDHGELKLAAEKLADKMRKAGPPYHLVVAGGAGSGKTTLAGALSTALGIPAFDFDEYVRGGWTPDRDEYEERLKRALYDLWTDLPADADGWIVEHVESCSKMMTDLLRPNYALLVDTGEERLRLTAQARNAVGTFDPAREKRALQSMKTAKEQFWALPAKDSTTFRFGFLKSL